MPPTNVKNNWCDDTDVKGRDLIEVLALPALGRTAEAQKIIVFHIVS